MSVLAAWVVVGVPCLALGLALFVGRSPRRALLGYLVLGTGFALLTALHRTSGAVLGAVLALLYAAGRGGAMERVDPDAQSAQPLDRLREPGGEHGRSRRGAG